MKDTRVNVNADSSRAYAIDSTVTQRGGVLPLSHLNATSGDELLHWQKIHTDSSQFQIHDQCLNSSD